ncbi:hypothetical protein HPP92_001406 [Vanilla planifolia]|uniref:Zinc knuckle CX2CX4HX4C domain-containing protein n=1 Tax=Vanilla planifolia TaxID=51239 RepID=A0A835RQL6_VANPL|nr:hypothetical protein HPP92_001406 [Vanilla planifolia]
MASAIGSPLKVDTATAAVSRPHVAKVCVELDVTKVLPRRIRISAQSGVATGGFWQTISYDNLPKYCSQCLTIGHSREQCRNRPMAVVSVQEDKGKQPFIDLPRSSCSTPPKINFEIGQCSSPKSPTKPSFLVTEKSAYVAPGHALPLRASSVPCELDKMLAKAADTDIDRTLSEECSSTALLYQQPAWLEHKLLPQNLQEELERNRGPVPIFTPSPFPTEIQTGDTESSNMPKQRITDNNSSHSSPRMEVREQSNAVDMDPGSGRSELLGELQQAAEFPPLAAIKVKNRRTKNRGGTKVVSPPHTRSAAGSKPPPIPND